MTYEQIKAINDAMSSLTTICGNYIHQKEGLDKFINYHINMMKSVDVPKDIWEHYLTIAMSVYRYINQ